LILCWAGSFFSTAPKEVNITLPQQKRYRKGQTIWIFLIFSPISTP
jgi:hypothetical protein